ncbi:nitroreductase family protein [Jiangella asiatica]|uniref:Nitroreductase family protein n=1 Tax=Jiangella asiatica TaxID=2530372 RepID=A0A4R5D9X2_9ACTN|nr:nitroreductase family protein [Jiangella asiatica]TDE08234.1 nitroreductase family protein [Jiangella asiatica]
MEFADLVRRRRMIRNYDERPVDPAAVDRMLENALHAPSAGFSQGWAFLRLDTADDVARFWAASTPPGQGVDAWSEGLRRAPVVIVPMSSKQAYLDRYAEPDKGWTDRDEKRWPAPYWDIDTGMASLLILLTVVDEDLGACFFGIPPERVPAFREAFGVPATFDPIGAITVGHRAPDRRSPSLKRGRRGLDDVVHRGHWGGPLDHQRSRGS